MSDLRSVLSDAPWCLDRNSEGLVRCFPSTKTGSLISLDCFLLRFIVNRAFSDTFARRHYFMTSPPKWVSNVVDIGVCLPNWDNLADDVDEIKADDGQ